MSSIAAPQIAISDEFLSALSKLPKHIQKKVRDFTKKFRADPTSSSINYEPINDVVDDKVRTVRIDLQYRAIVVHPPKGHVYLLTWVDNHDEAMAWARKKRFDIHPSTGAIQVYTVEHQPPTPASSKRGLFVQFDKDDLIILGIPEALLPAIYAIESEDALSHLIPHLPPDAAEAVVLLRSGLSPEDTLKRIERDRDVPEAVDVEDFSTALSRPLTQTKFKEVVTEQELIDILEKPLDLWRTFLHPSQRKLVDRSFNGPVRVLGGAGTGKTVVAMHRARYLAKKLAKTSARNILFTTYTKNLAMDIDAHLKTFCGEEYKAIEVVNLHRWVNQYVRSEGIPFQLVHDTQAKELWHKVFKENTPGDLELSFYKDEWEHVIQPYDILDQATYLKFPRKGRGTPLNRRAKALAWNLFEAYRRELKRRNLMEQADVIREARFRLEQSDDPKPYAAVVVDELQDFRHSELKLLRTLADEAANDLFMVGDGHQRIYRHHATLGNAGINVRGRGKKLNLNYRTTEKIRAFAAALLEGVEIDDLDEGMDSMKGYRSLRPGVQPQFLRFNNKNEEVQGLVTQVKEWLTAHPPREICIAARTNALVIHYHKALKSNDIPAVQIKQDAEVELEDGVRICTMHRMKGLEFPYVVLAGFDQGVMPLQLDHHQRVDTAAREDHLVSERCLAHVAVTRARDVLIVSSSGQPSAWLPE